LFDGGKLITGNGSYTGTVSFGWLIKLFGVKPCGGTAVASVPTSGYNLWTVYKAATKTQDVCITQGSWMYTDKLWNINRSSLFIDAAEDWKNGTNFIATQTVIGA
jgi:hypothetical protein